MDLSDLTARESHRALVRSARQRAGVIRDGIHGYLKTLAAIAEAWREHDWETLGYDSWDDYVDGEFGTDRLRLPAEHRQKAVQELRLAGLSQRAIAKAVNAGQSTIRDDLNQLAKSGEWNHSPDATVGGRDGKTHPARRQAPTAALVESGPDAPDGPVTPQPEPYPAPSVSAPVEPQAAGVASGTPTPQPEQPQPPLPAAPADTPPGAVSVGVADGPQLPPEMPPAGGGGVATDSAPTLTSPGSGGDTPDYGELITVEPSGLVDAVTQSIREAAGETTDDAVVLEAAMRSAATLVTDVQRGVRLILAGVRRGAPIVTQDMVVALRAAADELERTL